MNTNTAFGLGGEGFFFNFTYARKCHYDSHDWQKINYMYTVQLWMVSFNLPPALLPPTQLQTIFNPALSTGRQSATDIRQIGISCVLASCYTETGYSWTRQKADSPILKSLIVLQSASCNSLKCNFDSQRPAYIKCKSVHISYCFQLYRIVVFHTIWIWERYLFVYLS